MDETDPEMQPEQEKGMQIEAAIHDIAGDLERIGFTDKEKVKTVLSDAGLFDKNIGEIKELLGLHISPEQLPEVSRIVEALGTGQKIDNIAGLHLREALAQAKVEELQIIDGQIEGLDPKQAFEAIIKDPVFSFYQGYHWNVLSSYNQPAVLKFTKYGDSHFNSADGDAALFETVQKTLGDEFLVQQVRMRLPQTERRIIMQEKLEPSEWSVLSTNRQESLDEIAGLAVKNPTNLEILKRFTNRALDLYATQGLSLDLLGKNIWYRLSQEGVIEIKVIDYGAFDKNAAAQNPVITQNIAKSQAFLEELKTKIA